MDKLMARELKQDPKFEAFCEVLKNDLMMIKEDLEFIEDINKVRIKQAICKGIRHVLARLDDIINSED